MLYVPPENAKLLSKHRVMLQKLGLVDEPATAVARQRRCQVDQDDLARALAKSKRLFFKEHSEDEIEQISRQEVAHYRRQNLSDADITFNVWLGHPDWPTLDWGFAMVNYRLFLMGVVPHSPTHAGELTADVQSQTVRDLILVTRLGFISVDSQPGVCETFRQLQTDKPGLELQREYIEGNFPTQFYKSLFDNLLTAAGSDDLRIHVTDGNERVLASHRPLVHAPSLHADRAKENPLTFAKLDEEQQWTLQTAEGDGPRYSDVFEEFADFGDETQPLYVLRQWALRNTVTFHITSTHFCRPGFVLRCLLAALVQTAMQNYDRAN